MLRLDKQQLAFYKLRMSCVYIGVKA